MNIPYTYLIGWKKLNKFYYGRRTSKNCHPEEFWKTYFTSSEAVKLFRKENGEPDIIEIRKIFKDIESCRIWEHRVLLRLNAARNDKFLNKRNGDKSNIFNTSNTKLAKDPLTGLKLGSFPLDDPKWKTGEIIHINKGRIVSDSTRQKQSANRKGTVLVFIPEENRNRRISIHDERWISGELQAANKGTLKGKKCTDEHISNRVKSRILNGNVLSKESRNKMSNTRKGKRPAFDIDKRSLGLISIYDRRWGTEIFKSR